jgi:hypothetical protein
MDSREAVLFPVSLSLSISPQEVDAGASPTLKAVAQCPEQYDLSGDPVLFFDAAGHEVGRAPLAALAGNDFGAEITITAPIELGEYGYGARLMPADGDGAAHAGASADARCTVKAHDAHINAWDIPSAITAGDTFSFHVGLKCSCGCNLTNRGFVVRDQAGTVVASGRLGDAVWPGTSALYFAEVQAVAPADISLHQWMVEFAGSNSGIAHAPGSLAMGVLTVAAPDREIRILAVDRDSGAPLKGINLIIGPYRATTGGDGVAQMKVVGDHYVLHASGRQRMPYRDHLDATRPIGLRLLMAVELPKVHFMIPVDQKPSIAEVLE